MELLPVPDAPRPIRLTVDDFAVLHEAGALDGHPHPELIHGQVVCMSPQRRRHSFARNEMTHRLRLALEAMGRAIPRRVSPP